MATILTQLYVRRYFEFGFLYFKRLGCTHTNEGDNNSTSGNFIILISPRNSPLASFAPLFLPSSSANKVAGLVQSPYEQNLQHRGLVHKENFLLHLSYLVASYSIFPNIFTLDNQ